MPEYVGALDLGTTSNRFIIFDHQGQMVALDQKEHEQIFPQPGWVEHDPMEIWNNAVTVMRNAVKKSGTAGSDIQAVGITNQRETTIVWNRKTGEPLYNAIVWQCTRTDGICRELIDAGGQDRFRGKPACPWPLISRGPKSDGSWITCRGPGRLPRRATPVSAPWKAGWSGGSPADRTVEPMSPT
jgi:glycerol kinase